MEGQGQDLSVHPTCISLGLHILRKRLLCLRVRIQCPDHLLVSFWLRFMDKNSIRGNVPVHLKVQKEGQGPVLLIELLSLW